MGAQNPFTAPWPTPSQTTVPVPAPGTSTDLVVKPTCIHVENPSPITDIKIAMEGRNFQLRSLLAYGVRPPKIYKGGGLLLLSLPLLMLHLLR